MKVCCVLAMINHISNDFTRKFGREERLKIWSSD